jgi:hypothetical protein
MTFLLIAIVAWLAVSATIGLVLARAFTLNEESESRETVEQRHPQLQLLPSPSLEHERAA